MMTGVRMSDLDTADFRAVVQRAWECVCLAWAWAWAWLRVRVFTARRQRDDWAVYKVYAFEDSSDAAHENHRFHELSARFFNPDTWEDDALDATGWDRVRVEVRYRARGQKYRMVLRHGDVCVFPPVRRPLTMFPLTVLAASLHGELDVDVTRRVLKYQGATRDFHGTRVTVRDLFPFDDHDDNAERFEHLRVIDSWARVTAVPYASTRSILWHVREAHATGHKTGPSAEAQKTAEAQTAGAVSMNGSVEIASGLGRDT